MRTKIRKTQSTDYADYTDYADAADFLGLTLKMRSLDKEAALLRQENCALKNLR